MPSRGDAPVTRPATYSITRDGLTVWHGGKAVLVIPREALPGVALRCLVAWHEGEAWLGGSDDTDIGARAQLRHHPVAPFKAGDDGEELIEPFDA